MGQLILYSQNNASDCLMGSTSRFIEVHQPHTMKEISAYTGANLSDHLTDGFSKTCWFVMNASSSKLKDSSSPAGISWGFIFS